jgi:tetraacyldisaccharide-1-P 4'-kinase
LICLDARLAFHVFMEGLPDAASSRGSLAGKTRGVGKGSWAVPDPSRRAFPDRLGALQGRLREKGVPNVAVIGRLSFRDNPTGENISLGELRNQKVLALSGLGDPASFEMSLTRVGALVQGQRYGDHHSFSSRECADVLERARREERRVVVTEKDWERLPETFPALVARLEWELPEEEWPTWIESVFS